MKNQIDDYLANLHEGVNTSAAAYAIGKTAEIVTRPARWLGKKAGKFAVKKVKQGSTAAKKSMISSIKDRYKRFKNHKNIPKKPKQQGMVGALWQGIRGK